MGRGKFHAKSILGCEVIENNAELKKMAFFKIYDLILEELFFSQIKIRKLQTNHFIGLNFGFKKWLYDEVKTRGKSKHVVDLWCNLLEHPLSYQSKKKSLQTLSYMSEPFNLQIKKNLF